MLQRREELKGLGGGACEKRNGAPVQGSGEGAACMLGRL